MSSPGSADVARTAADERAIVTSTSSQLLAKALHLALNVVISVALIRYLGPTGYGEYVLVVTTVGLLGLVSDFGLTKLAVRDVARDEAATGTVIGTVVAMRIVTGLVAAGAVQAVLVALGSSTTMHRAAAVASGIYLAEAFLAVTVVFHARIEQQYEALVRVAMEVVELSAVLWAISVSSSLVVIMATPVAGALVGGCLAWWLARRRAPFTLRIDRGMLRGLARDAAVVGPIAFVGVAYLKLDAVFVSIVLGATAVGLYGAAYQPVEYLLLASAVVVNVLFALLARASAGSDDFHAVYRNGTAGLLAVFLPVPIAMSFVASDLVELVYGPGYEGSAGLLRVLAWALVPLVLHSWQSFVLLAAGHQRVMLPILSMGVVANIAVDLVLLRWLGPVGAAYGTLLTGTGLLLATTSAVSRHAGTTVQLRSLMAVLGAGAGLAVAIGAATVVLPPLPAAAMAALAYPLLLQRAGVVDWASIISGHLRTTRPAEPAVAS